MPVAQDRRQTLTFYHLPVFWSFGHFSCLARGSVSLASDFRFGVFQAVAIEYSIV